MKKKITKIYRLAVELLSRSDLLTHSELNIPRKVFFVRKTELSQLICLGKHLIYTIKIHSSDPKLNSIESYDPKLNGIESYESIVAYDNSFLDESRLLSGSIVYKFLEIYQNGNMRTVRNLTVDDLNKLKANLEKGIK